MLDDKRLRHRRPTFAVKDSAQKVLAKLRQNADTGTAAAAQPDAPAAADDPLEVPWTAPVDTTGETVFDDRALRFRSLTVSDAEMAAINITRDEFHGEWNYTITPNSS